MRRVVRTPLVAAAAVLLIGAPAQADPASPSGPQVSVTPSALSPDGPTRLEIHGTGFESIPKGFGGVYVLFGHVGADWQPSAGGVTGTDYRYQVDAQTKHNHGYQAFVSFPNGGTLSAATAVMDAAGTWHVDLTVPGPIFEAKDRNGVKVPLDCRTTTCGVITIGAHGVADAANETFTPVPVRGAAASAPAPTPGIGAASGPPSMGALLAGGGAVVVLGAGAAGVVRRRRRAALPEPT